MKTEGWKAEAVLSIFIQRRDAKHHQFNVTLLLLVARKSRESKKITLLGLASA